MLSNVVASDPAHDANAPPVEALKQPHVLSSLQPNIRIHTNEGTKQVTRRAILFFWKALLKIRSTQNGNGIPLDWGPPELDLASSRLSPTLKALFLDSSATRRKLAFCSLVNAIRANLILAMMVTLSSQFLLALNRNA